MSKYSYFTIRLQLKENLDEILTYYLLGAIEQSLTTIFGEIGGCTELEILNHTDKNFTLKLPFRDEQKVRAALTFIPEFKGIPCYFHVTNVSSVPAIL